MNFRIHDASPADAVEQAFFRIQSDQMADVPILNPALNVEAVDFQRWQGHWLGIVVTPCLLYTSPSPRDRTRSRMPSSA